jgi:hypothetical protein
MVISGIGVLLGSVVGSGFGLEYSVLAFLAHAADSVLFYRGLVAEMLGRHRLEAGRAFPLPALFVGLGHQVLKEGYGV